MEFQQALMPQGGGQIGEGRRGKRLVGVAHRYEPAQVVGGDFYYFLPVDEDRVMAFVGDVMGHGVRSALVTAILRAMIVDVCGTSPDPGAVLTEINRRFHEIVDRSGQTAFVTAVCLLIDLEAGEVSGASAGHPSPLRLRTDGTESAEDLLPELKPGLALGLVGEVLYQTVKAGFCAGEMALLYTDGLFEAEDSEGTQLGEQRLREVAAESAKGGAEGVVRSVAGAAREFAGGKPQDDLCLLALEMKWADAGGNGGIREPK